eukprot:1914273-Prymnesium_polylepis.1
MAVATFAASAGTAQSLGHVWRAPCGASVRTKSVASTGVQCSSGGSRPCSGGGWHSAYTAQRHDQQSGQHARAPRIVLIKSQLRGFSDRK